MSRTMRRPSLAAGLIAGAAAAASAAAGPVVRRVMQRGGILDNPNERSSHTVAVPRGGGWACLVGAASGLGVAAALGKQVPVRTAAGAALLAAVGFADDRWSISALPRLAAQLGVGVAADAVGGHFPLVLVTVPTLVNVVNFMDGINGISALTTAVWGANAVAVGARSGNDHVLILGAALGGAAIGFLPHNLRCDRMSSATSAAISSGPRWR